MWLPSVSLAYVADESSLELARSGRVRPGRWTATAPAPLWVLDPAAAACLPGRPDRHAVLRGRGGNARRLVAGQRSGCLPASRHHRYRVGRRIAGEVLYVVAEWPDQGNSLEAIDPDGSVETLAGSAGAGAGCRDRRVDLGRRRGGPRPELALPARGRRAATRCSS